MGKKYIVDLNNETQIIVEVGANSTGAATIASNPVSFLKPYTEPDLEQIRKEAYEQGYKKCLSEHDFDSPCVSCDEYKRGLADAWEAARNVVALSTVDRREVFGSEYMYSILEKHTASEAIEKIRQYEKEKEEMIDIDKNKVEALANDIGIHKLYALVKEIRGE